MFRHRFPPLELPKQVQGVIPAPGTLSPNREARRDSPSDTIYISTDTIAWTRSVKNATSGPNRLLPRTVRVR